jgi:hypothetical protein
MAGRLAGLLIVVSHAVVAQSPPRWQLKEELRIGELEEESLALGAVGSIAIDREGSIIVGDMKEHAIRVFDRNGKPVRRFGRHGEGPGEFGWVGYMGLLGDTLYVTDPMLRRTSFFTPAGKFIHSFGFARLEVKFPFSSSPPQHFLSDGSAIVRPGYFIRPDVRLLRTPTLRIDRDGNTLDTIAITTGRVTTMMAGDPKRPQMFGLPFSFNPQIVIAAAARHGFIIDQAEAKLGRQADFTIRKFNFTGDTLWTRQYPYCPRRVSPQVRDSLYDAAEKRFTPLLGAGARAAAKRGLKMPTYWNPIDDAISTTDGGLWLKLTEGTATTVKWLAVDRDGRIVGELELARQITPVVVDGATVYARERGEFDIPQVVRYRIVR